MFVYSQEIPPMYPLNYLFNNFLPKRPMPKLSLFQVILHINVNINF